jgi:hypothetical protein
MTNTTGKTKAVNYSQAMLDTMATMYTGADNKAEVAAIAKKLGKTAGSVRAKLSQLGVYEVAAKTATASTRTKKADLCAQIGKIANLKEAEIEGLEKATAAPLEKILKMLTTKGE